MFERKMAYWPLWWWNFARNVQLFWLISFKSESKLCSRLMSEEIRTAFDTSIINDFHRQIVPKELNRPPIQRTIIILTENSSRRPANKFAWVPFNLPELSACVPSAQRTNVRSTFARASGTCNTQTLAWWWCWRAVARCHPPRSSSSRAYCARTSTRCRPAPVDRVRKVRGQCEGTRRGQIMGTGARMSVESWGHYWVEPILNGHQLKLWTETKRENFRGMTAVLLQAWKNIKLLKVASEFVLIRISLKIPPTFYQHWLRTTKHFQNLIFKKISYSISSSFDNKRKI